jgi:hypothetical protein
MKLITISVMAIIALSVSPLFALVDYSEGSQFQPKSKKPSSGSRMRKRSRATTKSVSSTRTKSSSRSKPRDMGVFRLAMGMESIGIRQSQDNSKVALYRTEGHFQTLYNIYFDTSYWYASSSSEEFAALEGSKSGNPTVKLGLNWLQMGGTTDLAMVNLYGGAMIAQKNAIFASSRTDKIAGIETSKRFHSFVFGLGYELRMTGAPKGEDEMDLGNVHGVKAALGWTVSSDIRFLLEADRYRILPKTYDKGEKNVHPLALDRELVFSHVTAKLFLGIGPFVELAMGARFRTSSPEEDDVPLSARLWDIPSGYGNSIFSSLNISI